MTTTPNDNAGSRISTATNNTLPRLDALVQEYTERLYVPRTLRELGADFVLEHRQHKWPLMQLCIAHKLTPTEYRTHLANIGKAGSFKRPHVVVSHKQLSDTGTAFTVTGTPSVLLQDYLKREGLGKIGKTALEPLQNLMTSLLNDGYRLASYEPFEWCVMTFIRDDQQLTVIVNPQPLKELEAWTNR